MQPSVRPQPTTPATRSSLMQFCIDTTQPEADRYCRISVVAHTVSYDLTATNAMSIGFCFARFCTSVRCMALTFTVIRSCGVIPKISMPCAFICSTCSGQGSIRVTSWPAAVMWAPA